MAGNNFPSGKCSKEAAGYTRAQKREEPEPPSVRKEHMSAGSGYADAKRKQDVRRTLIPPSERDSVCLELFLRGRGGGHLLYVVSVGSGDN